MDGTFVDAIAKEARRPRAFPVGNRTYAVHDGADGKIEVHEFAHPLDVPAALALGTLAGLIEYLDANVDELEKKDLLLVIDSPQKVLLLSKLKGEFSQRYVYATCEPAREAFPFDKFLDHEMFMITAQSRFVETEELSSLLRVVGTIKEASVKTMADDGVTQQVTATNGIHLVENLTAPRFVKLQPYRTFAEVEQPASRFLLRLKPGTEGGKPMVALIEADGGAWELDASKRIAEYLKPTGVPIIP